MKLAVLVVVIVVLSLAAATLASIEPSATLIWSDFSAITVTDSIAVLAGPEGVMSARFDMESHQFVPLNYLDLPGPITRLKQCGTTIVAQSSAGTLFFLSRAELPQLILVGAVTPSVDYRDFTLIGQRLFLACGFEGIRDYRITSFSTLTLVDSSLVPLHAVAVETHDDRLFVVDDYSGIVMFDAASVSLGEPVGYYPLSNSASSFATRNDTAYVGLSTPAILRAVLRNDSLVAIDTLPVHFQSGGIQVVDSFVVSRARSGDGFDIVSLSKRHNVAWVDSGEVSSGSSAFVSGNSPWLVITDKNAGLALYDLGRIESDLLQPVAAYQLAGAIVDVATFDNSFIVARDHQPILAFRPDGQALTLAPQPILPGLKGAVSIATTDDRIVALYPAAHLVAVIGKSGDTYTLTSTIDSVPEQIRSIRMTDAHLGTVRVLFLLGDSFVDVYSMGPTWDNVLQARLFFPEHPVDAVVLDSTLIIGTKSHLFVYTLSPEFEMQYCSTVDLTTSLGDPNTLVKLLPPSNGAIKRAVIVCGESVSVYNISNPYNPTIIDSLAAPWGLTGVANDGDYIYLASVDRGLVSVLSASGGGLSVIDSVAAVGEMIAVRDGTIAIAGAHAARLYEVGMPSIVDDWGSEPLPKSISLHQNYPNPFNPSTTIAYSIARRERVTITVFNVIGQEVARPVDATVGAGQHEFIFDSDRLSSGVYLYRMTVGSESQTRKMVLVK